MLGDYRSVFVYEIADASRYWYLHIKEELIKLGEKLSTVDQGVFYWKEIGKLTGIPACHVDHTILEGNQ